MKLLSINVGQPRPMHWAGKQTMTGIFKTPLEGPVAVRRLNIDGDGQADLSVHGGIDKAVYAYPSEHYAFWQAQFPDLALPWGAFGENLTIQGLLETEVSIGDVLRIGSVTLRVTQPRLPCFKLANKFSDRHITRVLLESRRTGFYFAVTAEGRFQGGEPIAWVDREPNHVTIDEAVQIYNDSEPPPPLLERARRFEALPEYWRKIIHG